VPALVDRPGYAVYEKIYRLDSLTPEAFEVKILSKRATGGWATKTRSGFHRGVFFWPPEKEGRCGINGNSEHLY
jgi:hypothetical protein